MTVQLPEDLEASILAEVRSGHFASPADALAAAWRAYLEHQDAPKTSTSSAITDERRRENLARLCEQLEAMPTAPVRDSLTNRDHDQILYSR